MPKVSVIMPIYNTSIYLRDALDSVVRQTLKDIEIICINDGSTDNSLDIVKEYAANDERIIIINKKNTGYGHTMNVGLDTATGDYIGILETDDFLSLNMFEELYYIAVENDLDSVRADFFRFVYDIDRNMNLTYIAINKTRKIYGEIYNPSIEPDYLKLTLNNTWAGIYRLSFLREYGIRHNETPGASFQDNGFFWQVHIYAKRVMLINKPYYYCRRDNPNSSVKAKNKVWAMSREYDFIRDILLKDKNIWNNFKRIYWLYKYWNNNFTENRISFEYMHDFISRISKEYRRAIELEEISKKEFIDYAWRKINFITNCPEGYLKLLS
jgi:glycosyltransferase involved in cell wall biosynthesis